MREREREREGTSTPYEQEYRKKEKSEQRKEKHAAKGKNEPGLVSGGLSWTRPDSVLPVGTCLFLELFVAVPAVLCPGWLLPTLVEQMLRRAVVAVAALCSRRPVSATYSEK